MNVKEKRGRGRPKIDGRIRLKMIRELLVCA
jgi:hypothetical protein